MKRMNYLKGFLPWQSEFDHHFACWASNHRGWAKMKKSNKRLAKRAECRFWKRRRIPLQMTMAEKREFLERMQELVKHNILRKEDRDAVYRICLAACGRELEELKRED